MRPLIVLVLILLLFPGCDDGSSSNKNSVPAAVTTMNSKLASDMDKFMPRVARFEGFLVFIFNPGTTLAQGVTLTPDTSLGAPPHSFTFSGPYDGNEDGINETTLSGSATFDSDPDVAWSGVTGEVEVDVTQSLAKSIMPTSTTLLLPMNDSSLGRARTPIPSPAILPR